MTTRHRFLGRKDKATDAVLCGESFGGVSQCGLPYASDWHYSDDEHPWTPAEDRAGECGWRLQEGTWGANGMVCSADQDDNMHVTFPTADGEALTGVVPIPIHVTMQYPVKEAPVAEEAAHKGWLEGNVYPPGDDGGAPVAAANPTYADAEAATERLQTTEALFAPVNTGDVQPEWSRAIGFLKSEQLSLNYGPWPIRKFLLHDGISPDYTEQAAYEEYVSALDQLSEVYSVQVYRPEGMPWRFALVTWNWATGYTVDVACDELAAMYG